jgi:hypothetical protein
MNYAFVHYELTLYHFFYKSFQFILLIMNYAFLIMN